MSVTLAFKCTLHDAEICEIVSQSSEPPEDEAYDEEEDEKEEECQISNSDAARMFERGLSWLEHQPEATVYNTSVLRELHALAAKKRMESIKQTKLSNLARAVIFMLSILTVLYKN